MLLSLLYPCLLRAGEPLYVPHGADAMGMAFAVTAATGHWNGFHNQALMAMAPSSGLSAAAESRFMIPDLSTKGVSAVIAAGNAPIGLVVTHFGNVDYHRIFAGAGSAVKISDKLSAGVQIDYITERSIGDYRDISHVTFEAGFASMITPTVRIGIHLFNPLPHLNTLPSSAEAGIAWEESDRLLLALMVAKVSSEPLSLQCGLCWRLHERMALRTGYMSSPQAFTFGIGLYGGPLQCDVGFLMNVVTGMTSSISVIWSIGRG